MNISCVLTSRINDMLVMAADKVKSVKQERDHGPDNVLFLKASNPGNRKMLR